MFLSLIHFHRNVIVLQTKEENTVPYNWRQAVPEDPLPDFAASIMPSKKPSHLPRQDNYCDCGLFALTYMHYFSFMPPERLNPDTLKELGGGPLVDFHALLVIPGPSPRICRHLDRKMVSDLQ